MSIDLTTKKNCLAHWEIGKKLSKEKLQAIINLLEERQYQAGKHIIDEKTQADGVYFVVKGVAEVVKSNLQGKQRVVAELHRGQNFGDYSILLHSRRTATVIAKTDCVCLFISVEILNSFIDM